MDSQSDNAIRARLAKLADMPVDTARLEQQLRAELDRADDSAALRPAWWATPLFRIAAALVLLASVAALIVVNAGDSPVLATPLMLSDIHGEVVAGDSDTVAVSDLAEVRRVITAQWSEAPSIPEFAVAQVESCCVHHVGDRRFVCVVGRVDGTPVTMVVAHADDLRPDRNSGTMTPDGFCCHTHGQQNMVCKQAGDRTICLVADLPIDRLVHMAAASRF